MDGLSHKKLIEWLDVFEISSTRIDSQHIDTIVPIINRDKWVDIAFDLYESVFAYIQQKSYYFVVVLALYLNSKKAPSKYYIRKMIYQRFSHQTTPPELYLIKDAGMIEQWQKRGIPLAHFSIRYGGNAFYDEFYSEEEECYERTVFYYKT